MRGDFTRDTFRPEKGYDGVLMQQGRVQLDADWNEQVEITRHLRETTAADVIGGCGGPQDAAGFGLRLEAGELVITAGRYYVDGILCQNREQVAFTEQGDLPGAELPADDGVYLAYLDVWRRHLTALEDPEIREVALGGPDTATRSRPVCQVRLLELGDEVEDDVNCASDLDAWDALSSPHGRLQARARAEAAAADPCLLPPGGGFTGLENYLYRLEIHAGGGLDEATFKWSSLNASVAVAIEQVTGANQVRVASLGRDEVLRLEAGNWVEVLDDRVDLAGGPGVMRRIASIDEAERRVTLDGGLGPIDPQAHPKLRRWQSGEPIPVTQPVENDGYLHLEHGVEVRFEGGDDYRSGDYWWIPARTETGDVEWPEQGGAPAALAPRGIEHHHCRLALVRIENGAVVGVEDCRNLFPPLGEVDRGTGTCCTVTVGDGVRSHGEVDSIAEALERLPSGGGKICLLAGDFREHVVIQDRRRISLHGCGERTRLHADPESDEPVIAIRSSRRIAVRSLAIVAPRNLGIEITSRRGRRSRGVGLEELEFSIRDRGAIDGDADEVEVHGCRIHAGSLEDPLGEIGIEPAVFLTGRSLSVERNRITADASEGPLHTAPGGVQIGGGSERVSLRRNHIRGGNGNGVTLGSVRLVPRPAIDSFTALVEAFRRPRRGARIQIRHLGCGPEGNPMDPDPDFPPDVVGVSDGDLERVEIVDNEILDMGFNGISAARFFEPERFEDLIAVSDLLVAENRIAGCVTLTVGEWPQAMLDFAAFGGIVLSQVSRAVFRDNLIEGNGAERQEAMCGCFLLAGTAVAFTDNRILFNGRRDQPQAAPPQGHRGGIVLRWVQAETVSVVDPADGAAPLEDVARQNGVPAVRVTGNVVVSHSGRALHVLGLGPMVVTDNQLTTHGAHFRVPPAPPTPAGGNFTTVMAAPTAPPLRDFIDSLGGAVVAVVNLGFSNEIYFQLAGLSGGDFTDSVPDADQLDPGISPLFQGGNVMFNDNQVVLDGFGNAVTVSGSSVLLASFDDVAMVGNQCDCDLLFDWVLTNALVIGTSLRVSNNRFKEGIFNAWLSAFTYAWFNNTSNNQGTHCIVAAGHPGLSLAEGERHNRTLAGALPPPQSGLSCRRWSVVEQNLSQLFLQQPPSTPPTPGGPGPVIGTNLHANDRRPPEAQAADELQAAPAAIDRFHGAALDETLALADARDRGLRRENARLVATHGEDAPPVRAVAVRQARHQAYTGQLRAEGQRTNFRVPPRRDRGFVVYGQVFDARTRRGRSELTVAVLDGDGRTLAFDGTDERGFFDLLVLGGRGQLPVGEGAALVLQVSDPRREVLLRSDEALAFKEGGRVFRRLPLGDQAPIVPPPGDEPPGGGGLTPGRRSTEPPPEPPADDS